jgi:hypothetical protein
MIMLHCRERGEGYPHGRGGSGLSNAARVPVAYSPSPREHESGALDKARIAFPR